MTCNPYVPKAQVIALAALAALAGTAFQAAAQNPKIPLEYAERAWRCSAPGLAQSNYDGGRLAFIRLDGSPTGTYYPVQGSRGIVTGKTRSGTKFTCKFAFTH